jgi:hypothetical protein
LRVAEFSTRNLDIPTRILLVLYSKFRALICTAIFYLQAFDHGFQFGLPEFKC